ncbi:DUF5946 family protein [Pseudokineococcus sp. 1T1Z-3]|uniref:DUF5946 family protein n=1 Tax=Pseudokineococcus sp. 1T1Z-3 TaxID=3132745 RepID=UPI0030ADBBBB
MRATETGRGPESRAARCLGCGALLPPLPAQAVAPHPYTTAFATCWSAYGQLLAAQYTDPARMLFHQLLVDAYVVQHPGDPTTGERDRRVVQSVGIHLMTLCLFFEHEADPAEGTGLHRRMVARPALASCVGPPTEGT